MRARFHLPALEVPRPWRLAVLIVAGVLLAAFGAWWAGTEDASDTASEAAPVAEVPADPLKTELRRCQSIGDAGAHDTACLAAWAESRRRFLGGHSAASPER